MAGANGARVPQTFNAQIESLVNVSHHPPENVRKIIRDVFDCCRQFNGLKPTLEDVQFANTTHRLIAVGGVIPVNYRGVVYYIPIMIQLGRQHPNEPPIPYVQPTESMIIRENHRYVHSNGRVYIPHYLDVWSPPQFSLYGLVVAMIRIFSEIPPVLSRHRSQQGPQQQQQQQQQQHHHQQQQQQHQQQIPPTQHYPQPRPHSSGDDDEKERSELRAKLTEKLAVRFSDSCTETIMELAAESARNTKMIDNMKQVKQLDEKENERHGNLKAEYEILTQKEKELLEWKENTNDLVSDEDQQNIDTLLQFRDMLTHQIAKCIAEDYAMNDTMDQIDEAFVKNIVDHDKYLREIRALSRKQFYPRALRQKLELQYKRSRNTQQNTNPNTNANNAHNQTAQYTAHT